MRILALVTDAFGGIGGIAQFNRDFLTALSSHTACDEIVVLPRHIQSEEKIPSKILFSRDTTRGKFSYLFSLVRTLRKNPKFDLIFCGHIHLLPLAFLARFLGANGQIVLMTHGIEAWQTPGRPFLRSLVSRINALLSTSEFTKKRLMQWVKLSGIPSFILPCAVDLHRYAPGPKNPAFIERYGLQGKKVLLTLARLSSAERYKGIEEVIDLLPELCKEVPNLVYLVAGEGDDRPRLEKKAEAAGLGNHVLFLGFVAENEKADLYRLADVFVMPSRGEGFGLVYLEALACGIPVVASGIDATGEYLKDLSLVFLANPDHPEEIKQAVMRALKVRPQKASFDLEAYSIASFTNRTHRFLDYVA